MKLKIFGSNSKGNGYALTDNNGKTLLIECGVPIKEVKKYLDFDLTNIIGCLVSHMHGDHIKYVNQYLSNGIDVAMELPTAVAMGIEDHHRVKLIEPMKKYFSYQNVFAIMPISMKHDVPCLAFLIKHEEMGNTVFITDSYYSPVKFANINNWIVEANYSHEILDEKVVSGSTHGALRNRILTAHMSIEHCVEMFRANDTSQTNNIVLTHLSDTNSNANKFKALIEEETLKTVHIAEAGMEIELNKTPF